MQPTSTSETLLPRAVRRQVQAVNDRLAARSAAPAAPALPTAPAAADPTATSEPTAAAPIAAPVPPAPPAPPTPPASTADARESSVDYWRERFRVMQGVNEKQRNDHADAIGARDRELADLRRRVQELEQASSSTPQSNKLDLSIFFTPEQIEKFGEDSCEAMARAALKAAKDQAQQIIDAEVKPLKERQQSDDAAKAKAAQDAFWKTLDQLVAKIPQAANRTIWEINEEQSWLDFLDNVDDDGETRNTKLHRFQRALNAQGIANLVKQYLTKAKPTPPAPPVAPGGGAGAAVDQQQPNGAAVNGKGYPSPDEFADYSKRAATIRNPRDPRYVTEQERQEMEARLRLPRPGGR